MGTCCGSENRNNEIGNSCNCVEMGDSVKGSKKKERKERKEMNEIYIHDAFSPSKSMEDIEYKTETERLRTELDESVMSNDDIHEKYEICIQQQTISNNQTNTYKFTSTSTVPKYDELTIEGNNSLTGGEHVITENNILE